MRLLALLCLVVLAMAGGRSAQGEAMSSGPRISDTEFFGMLNLELPGLDKVKASADAGDMTSAKREFAEYLRRRQKPVWKPEWLASLQHSTRTDKTDTREADRIMQRDLPSVGVYHKYDGEIDWTLNPINYREWPWQLNRHPFWTTLGLAYWATGEEKYAKEFVYQMTDWVRQCPVPLDNNGNRSETWRTIEAGIRTGHHWPSAYYLFLNSPSFTDDAIVTMVKSMVEHAQHLMRWPQTGNWLTMECNGLMHVGVLFPEFKDAETWRKTASERLYAELDKQVYPDGAQIELSTGYHQVSLLNFAAAWNVAHINGVEMPADYVAKMQRMFDYDLDVSMPDGYAPGLNDAGRTNMMAQAKMGLTYFPERKDYQWLATLGKEGTKPDVGSIALPFSGHVVMRSGWELDDRYMLFDAGPYGYGHQHEDALSFVIYAYGKYMLVDPGNYPYDSSDWRRYVLSTRAHNTIRVDGLDQHRNGRPRQEYVVSQPMPIRWTSDAKFDYAQSTYDDGYGSDSSVQVKHTRSVVFVKPEYWIVVDTLVPSDEKPHRYESAFHLDVSGAEVDAAAKSVRTTDAKGANLSILPVADDGLKVSIVSGQKEPIVQGWMPAGGYTCRPIPTPIFSREQPGDASFAYVFYPTPEGGRCRVVKVEPLAVEGATAMAVRFENGRVDYFVQAEKRKGSVRFADFESDALVTYVRTESGRVVSALLADGTTLSLGGEKVDASIVAIGDLSRTTVRHKF